LIIRQLVINGSTQVIIVGIIQNSTCFGNCVPDYGYTMYTDRNDGFYVILGNVNGANTTRMLVDSDLIMADINTNLLGHMDTASQSQQCGSCMGWSKARLDDSEATFEQVFTTQRIRGVGQPTHGHACPQSTRGSR
jgi:hypothetical protein